MAHKKTRNKKRTVEALATGAALALGSSLVATEAAAAVITVDSTADTVATDTECTLREALINANSGSDTTGGDCAAGVDGPDVITFDASVTGTITLLDGSLDIYDPVDIQGPGRDVLTIDGSGNSTIIDIYYEGPAINVSISGLTLTNGYSYTGGAIDIEGQNVTISDARITGNRARYGGGIALYDGGSLTISDTIISGNTADFGGGISVYTDTFSSVSLDNVQLIDNAASVGAGMNALFTSDSGSVAIRNSTISGNDATEGDGGGVRVTTYETYTYYGGAALRRRGANPAGANARKQSQTISANRAARKAARSAVAPQSESRLRIKPSGAGLQVIVEDTTVSGNTTSSDGAGFYFGYVDDLQVRRTTLSGNIAGDEGGGAAVIYSSGVIENSTFANNTGNYGAALDIEDSTITIKETTINGNTATSPDSTAAGVDVSRSYLTIVDSIIANTIGDTDISIYSGNTTVSYTLIENPPPDPKPWTEGPGNIYGTDPLLGPLQDNGGSTETMEPLAGSPVIDAGDPAFAPPPATDQRGLPRVSGTAIDMGSVEVQVVVVVPGSFQFASPTYAVTEGGDVTITVNREGGTDGAVSVNVVVTGGTATSGTDYTFTGATLTWADGETGPKTFVIPALADLVVDPAETVNLALQSPTGGATVGVQSTTVLTITDVPAGPQIPTLGFLMKLLLVLGIGTTGVIVAGRGRLLVYLLAALLALSTAPGLKAEGLQKKPRAMKRAKARADRFAATVEQISRKGNLVTLKIGDEIFTVRASNIEVRHRGRGSASVSAVKAGTPVVMRVRRGSDGQVRRVRLVMFDTLESAKKAAEKKRAVQ